jgi:hypothetical protein
MKKNIDDKIKELVVSFEKDNKNDEKITAFENASKKFNELISKGLTKKRGYNLLSVVDKQDVNFVSFNKM